MEEERQRKAAVRKSKMESGLTMEDEEQLEKKAVREGKGRERKKGRNEYCSLSFYCDCERCSAALCSCMTWKISHYF